MLYTPKKYRPLAIYGGLLILLQPVFSILYYYWMQVHDAYPPEADSIGIPIFYAIIAWFIIAPLASLSLFWALKNYPGSLPLLFYNKERQMWSTVWSIIFLVLIVLAASTLPEAISYLNPSEIINCILWIILFVNLRTIVVAKKGWA